MGGAFAGMGLGSGSVLVVAAGQNIEPVAVDEVRMGVAETYDVIVEPKDDRAYTIFVQDIARSGFPRGTLTPDISMTAAVPEIDSVPNLEHGDMGMNMMGGAGHDMASMNGSPHQIPCGTMMPGMDHGQRQIMGGGRMIHCITR